MEKVKEIPFKRVDPKTLPPTRMTTGAVGYDLYVSQGVIIPPGKGELIPTGVAFEFPEGWFATVHLRSSMCKRGLLGSVGVVDEDFRGTVRVQAFNMTDEDILIVPGERIGYIAIAPDMTAGKEIYAAVCGAGRALGYVCAPSLFQKVVAKCVDARPDIAAYERNRNLIYGALTEMGYTCVRPDGAFYLFVKALEEDANAFADKAKRLGLLIVPGDDFGANGWVRVSYCVSYDMIERSLPAFRELMASYKA